MIENMAPMLSRLFTPLFDAVLVIFALLVDGLALAAMVSRISDFGLTPNRVAALGENVILLVNLAWSAWLYARFLRGRGSFRALAGWQNDYLAVRLPLT